MAVYDEKASCQQESNTRKLLQLGVLGLCSDEDGNVRFPFFHRTVFFHRALDIFPAFSLDSWLRPALGLSVRFPNLSAAP